MSMIPVIWFHSVGRNFFVLKTHWYITFFSWKRDTPHWKQLKTAENTHSKGPYLVFYIQVAFSAVFSCFQCVFRTFSVCFQDKKVRPKKYRNKRTNPVWDREAHFASHGIEGGEIRQTAQTLAFFTRFHMTKLDLKRFKIWIIIMYLETPFPPFGQCCLFMWPGWDRVYQHWPHGGRGELLCYRTRPTKADLAKWAFLGQKGWKTG